MSYKNIQTAHRVVLHAYLKTENLDKLQPDFVLFMYAGALQSSWTVKITILGSNFRTAVKFAGFARIDINFRRRQFKKRNGVNFFKNAVIRFDHVLF